MGTILPGSIVALMMEDQTPTAKVIYVNGMEMTVKLCGKNQLIVINNWPKAFTQQRMILKLKTEMVEKNKTIGLTKLLSGPPSWFTRIIGKITGYRYQLYREAMRVNKDISGGPRMAYRWCRYKKLTGTLYADGFFLSRRGLWVYIDRYNQFKHTVWKK